MRCIAGRYTLTYPHYTLTYPHTHSHIRTHTHMSAHTLTYPHYTLTHLHTHSHIRTAHSHIRTHTHMSAHTLTCPHYTLTCLHHTLTCPHHTLTYPHYTLTYPHANVHTQRFRTIVLDACFSCVIFTCGTFICQKYAGGMERGREDRDWGGKEGDRRCGGGETGRSRSIRTH